MGSPPNPGGRDKADLVLVKASTERKDQAPVEIACDLPDLAATAALAARLAPLLRPGDAVLLEGPLGAGKSAFARALLRAATGDSALEVPSPTFTLVQSYDLPAGPAHHFDLYRLSGPAGLAELGWDEAREGIVLVEWPERLGPLAPPDALRIHLTLGAAEEARHLVLSGWDARLEALRP
ncbi:MAG: tRNA (adenosine(37)-N6)-threonylcarbamoyltransferase complex ATPase subunit type 1 TsaE [Roseomonas sp.]|nr:tRNA (adenosine(37)-N6)-threonylcarbamoyltransferase complex ATPase subunit type 1 TsaE [Roseomonas sp.]MCA3299968.1 tRNA (adenosine(37)-N6)-threonylcarbamoyltransferase complex ATPase subunit type 1 TsaE [Roseomonas sp.]